MAGLSQSVSGLTKLRDLDAEHNALTSMPEFFGRLTGWRLPVWHLRRLNLRHNALESLPHSIGGLTALEEILLEYNSLSLLPSSMGKLKRLRTLTVHHNKLFGLPESFDGLEALTQVQRWRDRPFPRTVFNLLLSKYGMARCKDFALNQNRCDEETRQQDLTH